MHLRSAATLAQMHCSGSRASSNLVMALTRLFMEALCTSCHARVRRPRRATWQAGPLLSDRGAPSVQYDEMSLKLATYRMLFQGSNFSFDAGMLLSALLYASSAAFFFTWSSAFGASCCCLFPFAMAWAGAVTASKVIAIAAITVLILKSFRIWTARLLPSSIKRVWFNLYDNIRFWCIDHSFPLQFSKIISIFRIARSWRDIRGQAPCPVRNAIRHSCG